MLACDQNTAQSANSHNKNQAFTTRYPHENPGSIPRISRIIARPRIITTILFPQPQRHLLLLLLPQRSNFPIEIRLRRFITIIDPYSFLIRDRRFSLAEVFPFAPAVEVDEGLHAAPFHCLACQPFEVDRLCGRLVFGDMRVEDWGLLAYLGQEIIAAGR